MKRISVSDEDIRRVAEIEAHPEIRKWDIYNGTERAPSKDIDVSIRGFREFFKRVREDEKQLCLLAKVDGEVVGWLGIHRFDKPKKHVGDIGMSVHPDYQRKGIGTNLLKVGIKLAKEKGFKRLEVDTLAVNQAMRRTAEKVGFQLEGIRRKAINMHDELKDEVLYGLLL